MKLKVFTVYDVKAKIYLTPFFMSEVGQAIRSFSDAINDQEHQFYKHPEDYSLYYIGNYEDSTGDLQTEDRTIIQTGLEAIRTQKDVNQMEIPVPEKIEKISKQM